MSASHARKSFAFALALGCVVAPRAARAQLHADGSAQVGAALRFPDGSHASPGPALSLAGHVALFPLVRIGAYAFADLSPAESGDGEKSRDIFALGAHVKVLCPWPSGARVWLFAGLGYAGVYSSAIDERRGFLEVPFGIGGSIRIRKPWEIVMEAGARAGSASYPSAIFATVGVGLDR